MKQLVAVLVAAMFAATSVVALAQADKSNMDKKESTSKMDKKDKKDKKKSKKSDKKSDKKSAMEKK